MWCFRVFPIRFGATACLMLLACTPQAYFNNTTTLGGTTPGSRGSVTVVFDNRTPYRAVFTYGLFDQQDRNFVFEANQVANRQIGQFVRVPDPTVVIQTTLLGNTTSDPVTLICARTLAVGTQRLIEVIQTSRLTIPLDTEAMKAGISFWTDDAAATEPVARIDGVTVLQGYEFQAESQIVFTLTQKTDGTFSITWEVILP